MNAGWRNAGGSGNDSHCLPSRLDGGFGSLLTFAIERLIMRLRGMVCEGEIE
jgi:hypothetical protein